MRINYDALTLIVFFLNEPFLDMWVVKAQENYQTNVNNQSKELYYSVSREFLLSILILLVHRIFVCISY